MRKLVGEFLATLIFMFAVCGCVLSNLGTAGSILVVAFAAIAVIFSFGHLSGAHFNPAVTVGALVGGKIGGLEAGLYVVVQLIATVLAALFLGLVYPKGLTSVASELLVKPATGVSTWSALFMEAALTFVLVFVVYCVALDELSPSQRSVRNIDDYPVNSGDIESATEDYPPNLDPQIEAANEQNLTNRRNNCAIAIGVTIGFLSSLGGNISGGGFNPARVTGPAILALDFNKVWIFWVGDMIGAVGAGLLHAYAIERL